MFEVREEQRPIIEEGKKILVNTRLLYLAAEIRTGKSIMSMTIAHEMKFRNVLFLTTKKAIGSIEKDLRTTGYQFNKFVVTNYQQMLTKNKPDRDFDLYIFDEATILGGYPKPGAIAKEVKALAVGRPIIYLSGTPTAEGMSQIYHQLWVSSYTPFAMYTNFYKFSKVFVNVRQKWVNGFQVNDYSDGKEKEIRAVIDKYMVTFSQKDAGFESFVEEEVITVPMDPRIYQLMAVLKKKKVYQLLAGDTLIADTPVKLQSLIHQLSGGTCIGENKSHVLDESKAKYIKRCFKDKKIAIFFKFIKEGELLRQHFPNSTADPEAFNSRDDLVFICQFQSGRMGVNLSTADCLVMYNIDFSATTYFQVIGRLQTKTRTQASKVYWLFSEHGLEKHVYKVVQNKKSFTRIYFDKALKEVGEQMSLV